MSATLRFIPTFLAPSVEIGRRATVPHNGSKSDDIAPYFGSSSNFKLITASINCLNALGVYRHNASGLVAIFFLHTRKPLLSP